MRNCSCVYPSPPPPPKLLPAVPPAQREKGIKASRGHRVHGIDSAYAWRTNVSVGWMIASAQFMQNEGMVCSEWGSATGGTGGRQQAGVCVAISRRQACCGYTRPHMCEQDGQGWPGTESCRSISNQPTKKIPL